jgi:hypothetical protein
LLGFVGSSLKKIYMKKILFTVAALTAIVVGAKAQDLAFQSIAVSGASDVHVNIPTPVGSNLRLNGSWTIEAWVKPISVGNGSPMEHNIIESYGTSSGGYALKIQNNLVYIQKFDNASTYDEASFTPPGNAYSYNGVGGLGIYHIAGTYNQNTNELKLYIDGVLQATTMTTTTALNQENQLRIGSKGEYVSTNRSTHIDDIRIWDVARTQTEIQNSMSICLTGAETNLLAYYTINGVAANSILDKTSNTHHGTVLNATTSHVSGLLNNATFGTDIKTECGTYTWIDGNTYTSSNNTATYTLTNGAGCDSIVTLNLTINPIDVGVSLTDITISADNTSASSYQWINCFDNSVITGETNFSFTPTLNGDYAVTITENVCSETSTCVTVSSVGINEVTLRNVNIYPNPVQNELFIELENGQITHIDILDLSGKVIKSIMNNNAKSIDVSDLTQGIYILNVSTENGVSTNRFVK